MAKYTIDTINIGSEITYKSKSAATNLLTAKVIAKLDNSILLIEKINTAICETRMIDVSEIISVINYTTV